MSPVHKHILGTGMVSDGTKTVRLHSNMQQDEGELIQRIVATVKPSMTLETGMAYGVSTLYSWEALSQLSQPAKRIAIDPVHSGDWQWPAHVRPCPDRLLLHQSDAEQRRRCVAGRR